MFEIYWPAAFALLPLPWLLRWLLPAAGRPASALHISFMRRLHQLEPAAGPQARRGTRWPWLLIWLLLVCAVSRPQLLGAPLAPSISGRDMMIAVDLSASMEIRDMQLQDQPLDRLGLVKHWLGAFIERRRGDRLGLILFGSKAYVQAPLTYDLDSVAQWLNESFIGLTGRDTAIGDAIGLGIKRLIQQPASSRVLLLITDGANTAGEIAPIQAAQLAAEQGIRIFTIGVGADSQQHEGLLGLLNGEVDPSIDLDETTLREVAEITGGTYFRARDSASLEAIYAQLDELEPSLRAGRPSHESIPLYPWPLGAAWLLSLGMAVQQARRQLHVA
ncbi:MAG: VWA domain-containing protein [Halopseudomonas sp.]|uniref:vWA domain-containing protein n=1 Tax=Halopseudomonas sp. TaxID=2901191 RepID=UPI00300221C2